MGSPAYPLNCAEQTLHQESGEDLRPAPEHVPTVSVLVPTYNRAAFLESTLRSIFTQTVPLHEVLLVDDGSTDDTRHTVSALLTKYPNWKERLRYFQQGNQGKSVALNVGLKASTGDWIAFNDSDDQWLPRKLELQFKALAEYPEAGACFTDVRFMNNPRLMKTSFEASLPKRSVPFGLEPNVPSLFGNGWPGIFMQTMLVKSKVMRQIGEFDSSVRMGMDLDLAFRLGLVAPMCFVNSPLVEVDRTESRLIGLTTEYPMNSIVRLEVTGQLTTKWLSMTRDSHPNLRRSLLCLQTSTLSSLANQHVLNDDFRTARSVLLSALRQNPRTGIWVKWLWSMFAPGLLRKEIARREARR